MEDGFPTWVPTEPATHETRHFVIYFVPWAPYLRPKRDVVIAAPRLEAIRDALDELLSLGEVPRTRLSVWLEDRASDTPEGWGIPEPEGGWVMPDEDPDAPGDAVERAVVQRLLAEALGDAAARSSFIVDGLLGHLSSQLSEMSGTSVNAALADRLLEGKSVQLADLAQQRSGDVALYAQAVTSFTTFLLTTYGAERFKQLALQLTTQGPERAFALAYGKPLSLLEKEWLLKALAGHQRQLSPLGFLRTSLSALRPHAAAAALLVIALLPAIAWTVLHPFLLAAVIDQSMSTPEVGPLATLVGLLVALFALRVIGSLASAPVIGRISTTIVEGLRIAVARHLHQLPIDFFTPSQVATLPSRISSSLDEVYRGFTETLPRGLSAVLVLGFGLVALGVLEWRLALLTLVLLPFLAVGWWALIARTAHIRKSVEEDARAVHRSFEQTTERQRMAKAFGLASQWTAALRDQSSALAQGVRRLAAAQTAVGELASGGTIVAGLLVVGVGALVMGRDELSPGELVAGFLLAQSVLSAFVSLPVIQEELQRAAAGLRAVQAVLDLPTEVAEQETAHALGQILHEIRFDAVTFSYTGAQANLDNVSLAIPARTFAAIVGPRGSGKSTLIKLLVRLHDVMLGSIRIDGRDLREVTRASLRNEVGVVFQDEALVETTIRESIRMGRADVSDEDVVLAAQAAEIHDFILQLPHGYDTVVGSPEGRLSEGQRQRLALARALVRNPSLLLLDEATSALDPETEAAVTATLKRLARNRTILFVTHRLTPAREADQIYVLDHGRLAEAGTHDELLASRGLYHWLWQQQQVAMVDEEVPSPAVIADRLRAVPMFQSLDDEALATLANRFAVERYEPEEVVFEAGARADKFYLISRGQVEVIGTGPTGEPRVLAVLRENDYFGEMALRREAPRTTTVRTRGHCVLLTLERQHILKNMAHVLALPDEQRRLVNWVMRQREIGPADVAAEIRIDEQAAQDLLESLVAKGFVQEFEVGGQVRYRVRYAARRGPRVPQRIWDALDGKKPEPVER